MNTWICFGQQSICSASLTVSFIAIVFDFTHLTCKQRSICLFLNMYVQYNMGYNRRPQLKNHCLARLVPSGSCIILALMMYIFVFGRKFVQQDFDTSLAFINHERKQRTEVSSPYLCMLDLQLLSIFIILLLCV